MATNSTQESIFGAMRFSPLRGEPTMGSIPLPTIVVTTLATATAVTLTAEQLIGGLILQDPSGGGVTSTLPTAALLIAALPGVATDQSFQFDIRNTADASETITVAAGAGGTTSGTMTIAQNAGKRFLMRITSATQAAPTYTIYSLGAYTF